MVVMGNDLFATVLGMTALLWVGFSLAFFTIYGDRNPDMQIWPLAFTSVWRMATTDSSAYQTLVSVDPATETIGLVYYFIATILLTNRDVAELQGQGGLAIGSLVVMLSSLWAIFACGTFLTALLVQVCPLRPSPQPATSPPAATLPTTAILPPSHALSSRRPHRSHRFLPAPRVCRRPRPWIGRWVVSLPERTRTDLPLMSSPRRPQNPSEATRRRTDVSCCGGNGA